MDDRTSDPFLLTIGGTRDSRSSLRVVDHKFVIGKEEFLPYVAEMHYFRVAKRHWSVCFERIRKAGFRIISTAVPWNLHETRQGEFDFAGSTDPTKDLIVFLELCREFGFKIMLRPGPWLASEWDNGGIPEFVVRHPDNLAVDHAGQHITADPGAGAKAVALPSYLGNRFHILLKNYFSVLSEVVKNYIYPRGPVFMVELDHETSFAGHFAPLSADFSPQGSRSFFGQFLTEKYETIDRLNRLWKTRHKGFEEATPPETAECKTPPEFCRLMDWVEFREWVVNRYAEALAELMSQTEVSVLFTRSLAFHGSYHFPDVAGARDSGRVLYTVNLDWNRPFAETIRQARSVAGWQPTGFSTELTIGNRHADPHAGRSFRPLGARDSKRLLVAALAAGLKGFNFHMFVGRQRWYDAALEADGAILPSYEVIREAVSQLTTLRFETMRDFADVALVQYRPYQRAALLGRCASHGYLYDLMGAQFDATAADVMALGYDYRVFDLAVPDRLDKYGTVVVPTGEFMDSASQERLLQLAKGGAHLILYGVLPRFDNSMDPCEILAKGIGVRTSFEPGLLTVEAKHHTFNTAVWGTIKRAPDRAAKLVKAGTKLLGVSNKCGKGQVTVLTFSPGSHLLPEKLILLNDVLKLGKLTSPVFSSDPHVHVVLQGHAKAALLMVYDVADTLGMIEDSGDSAGRGVIVGADLGALGLTSPRVVLTDILGTESHKLSARDLKAGIEIRLSRGDSRLFSIERK
ncbi:MAG: beta-galactosidase [Candidatus Zixiibacteriota bacterium]